MRGIVSVANGYAYVADYNEWFAGDRYQHPDGPGNRGQRGYPGLLRKV